MKVGNVPLRYETEVRMTSSLGGRASIRDMFRMDLLLSDDGSSEFGEMREQVPLSRKLCEQL